MYIREERLKVPRERKNALLYNLNYDLLDATNISEHFLIDQLVIFLFRFINQILQNPTGIIFHFKKVKLIYVLLCIKDLIFN